MVRQVGGANVAVTSLVPKGGDVHTFEPKPADVQTVAGAQLIVMNGLGLDDWLREDHHQRRRRRNAARQARPWTSRASTLLPGEEPGTQNPHLWMDVTYAKVYVDRIAAALEQVDPTDAAGFDTQASGLQDPPRCPGCARSGAQIATIPAANRKLVTFHDAFPYFAREYGITIVGVAVEAPGQDPERGRHRPAHRCDQGGRRQGHLQREPVPDEARRPARRGDRREGRREPLRRLGRRPAGRLVRGASSTGMSTSSWRHCAERAPGLPDCPTLLP